MNRVILLGRLTSKPELKYTNANIPLAKFTIAVNRQFNNQEGNREADFINIIAWKKQAEVICNYFDKGNQIAIEGRLQTGSYDDKDGNKRYTTDVVLDTFHFIESKKQEGQAVQKTTYEVEKEVDPFASFGDSVSIDDNFLD